MRIDYEKATELPMLARLEVTEDHERTGNLTYGCFTRDYDPEVADIYDYRTGERMGRYKSTVRIVEKDTPIRKIEETNRSLMGELTLEEQKLVRSTPSRYLPKELKRKIAESRREYYNFELGEF